MKNEIIAHLVYYYEYYFSVLKAIAKKKEELPLLNIPLHQANAEGTEEYSKYTREELVKRFNKSENGFVKYIQMIGNADIPYKKGGRIYKRGDYTIVVARHIVKHMTDVKRSVKKQVVSGK